MSLEFCTNYTKSGSLKKYYPFLDGFRTVAIAGVMLTHISGFFKISTLSGHLYRFLYWLNPIGHFGVEVFFIISGFLITGILLEDWQKNIRIKRFYIRRFFKIVPHYYLAVIIGIIIFDQLNMRGLVGGYRGNPSGLCYFFFVQNYSIRVPTLEHTWSLVIEEQFYLIYPLILYLIFRNSENVSRRFLVFVSISLICIFCSVFVRHFGHVFNIPHFLISVETTLYRLDALVWGCLLKVFEPYYAGLDSRTKKNSAPLLCIAGFSVFLFFLCIGQKGMNKMWDQNLLVYLATTFIFLSAYFGFRPLNVSIENKLLRWIGKNSYGIFLWHNILIYLFVLLVPFLGVSMTIVFYVLATILVGVVTTQAVEKRFLDIRNKIVL